jgi:hypothetical protein
MSDAGALNRRGERFTIWAIRGGELPGASAARRCNPRAGPYNRPVARTWILTGSPENHAATRDHDFAVIVPQLTAAAGARG